MIGKTILVRLLLPLFLFAMLAGCVFPGAAEAPITTTPEQRAQGISLVQQASDALDIAAVWLEPAAVTKGRATLDALRKAIDASEFVPIGWATITGTAMKLAVIWLVPPTAPPPAAAPSG